MLGAWREFEPGKRAKPDVQAFGLNLLDNLAELSSNLVSGRYRHGPYERFIVHDPKQRIIHKASVRDRVLHRAVYRVLYPFFDRTFVADSFSCRDGKGTHRAVHRFVAMARRESRNHTRTVWVLKADIRRFFANIDHRVLLALLQTYVPDSALVGLLREIIDSFEVSPGRGLPLGNLTSQLFCNVYMNVFDQFVKHRLKARCYVRYADDFVVLSVDRSEIVAQSYAAQDFLRENLKLELHPDKVWVRTVASGADFLGWVVFPHHRTLRNATRRRMLIAARTKCSPQSLQSYLGLLSHGNAWKVRQELLNTRALGA